MKARSLRFMRALALLSGASSASGAISAGCDDDVLFPPDASAHDASNDENAYAEGAVESPPDAATPDAPEGGLDDAFAEALARSGSCRALELDAGVAIACGAGSSCSYPDDADTPRCTFGIDAAGDASDNEECGAILCAEYCYCVATTTGLCGCFRGPTGPLSPPELPRYTMSNAWRLAT